MKGYPWRHLNLVRVATISLILIVMCASANALTCDELKKYIDCESVKKADIVLVFDTTHSMHNKICEMKNITMNFADALNSSGIDYRLGLTEFDDFTGACGGRCGGILPQCGDVPYKIYNNGNLVSDPNIFNSWIQGLKLHCGGDGPESILAALNHTITDQKWRGGDVRKIAILISDSIPHPDGDCCNVEGDTFPGIRSALISNGVTLYIIGDNSGFGIIQPGWATDLATNTGGKFYDICLTKSLLPVMREIISYIRCSFNLDADAKCVSNKLDVCLKLIGKDGQPIPFDPENTSAWVVLDCPNCMNDSIKFLGTLISFTKGGFPGAPDYWIVKVDKTVCGPTPCSDTIKVVTYQSTAPPWGTADTNVKAGDNVWIYGQYIPEESGCEVTLHGSDQYYLKKLPDLPRYDLIYDPLKEAYCGTIGPACVDEQGNVKFTAFGKVCNWVSVKQFEVNCHIIKVHVDIKPGLCPNRLNLKVNENIPVAIVGTKDFDVKTIDPTTVRLGYNGNQISPVSFYYADVATPFNGTLCNCTDKGPDGILDLVLEFSISEINSSLNLPVSPGHSVLLPLTISGVLYQEYGSKRISGQDCVLIPCTKSYSNSTSIEASKSDTSGCHVCEMIADTTPIEASTNSIDVGLHTEKVANPPATITGPPSNDIEGGMDAGNGTMTNDTMTNDTMTNDTMTNDTMTNDTMINEIPINETSVLE